MTRAARVFLFLALAAVCFGPSTARAQVRAVVLQGDPAPGTGGATFSSFATAGSLPACDGTGHVAFLGYTSASVGGLWTDDLGTLAALALTSSGMPWPPGTGTLMSLGQPILSDDGHVAIYGTVLAPTLLSGIWVQDGAGLALAAGSGRTAPAFGGASQFNLVPPPSGNLSYDYSRNHELAVMGYDAIGTSTLWTIDPPPALGVSFCAAATGALVNPDIWSFGPTFSFNNHFVSTMQLGYYHGFPVNSWVAQGGCALLGPVLASGDLAPPVNGVPAAANVSVTSTVQPDMNGSNDVVFPAQLYNGGVTAANDELIYLRNSTGYHVVLREGTIIPGLAIGETLTPYLTIVGGLPPLELISDDGSVAFEAAIMPGGIPAVLKRTASGTLVLLARNGAAVPGYPGYTFEFPVGTPIEMNRFGQVLVRGAIWNPGHTVYNFAMVATDANDVLQPVFVDGLYYTVRPGLTGVLTLSQATPQPYPILTGGSDGQPRNFSDNGEFFFHGTFYPVGGGPQLDGIFAARGPVLTAGVPTESPARSWLEPVVPNPGRDVSRIAFDLAQGGHVRLEVLDLAGRRVRLLRDAWLPAGHYQESWVGDDAAGHAAPLGVYFVRMSAAGVNESRRVVRIR